MNHEGKSADCPTCNPRGGSLDRHNAVLRYCAAVEALNAAMAYEGGYWGDIRLALEGVIKRDRKLLGLEE